LHKVPRHDGKNRNDPGDYPHESVHHHRSKRHFDEELETPEERFDALKKNDESVLVVTDILILIGDVGIRMIRARL
jgi:hypothetical protein